MNRKLWAALVIIALLLVSIISILFIGGFMQPKKVQTPISDAEASQYYSDYLLSAADLQVIVNAREDVVPRDDGGASALKLMDGKYYATYKDRGVIHVTYNAPDGNEVMIYYKNGEFYSMGVYDEKDDLFVYISQKTQYQCKNFRKGRE